MIYEALVCFDYKLPGWFGGTCDNNIWICDSKPITIGRLIRLSKDKMIKDRGTDLLIHQIIFNSFSDSDETQTISTPK